MRGLGVELQWRQVMVGTSMLATAGGVPMWLLANAGRQDVVLNVFLLAPATVAVGFPGRSGGTILYTNVSFFLQAQSASDDRTPPVSLAYCSKFWE